MIFNIINKKWKLESGVVVQASNPDNQEAEARRLPHTSWSECWVIQSQRAKSYLKKAGKETQKY